MRWITRSKIHNATVTEANLAWREGLGGSNTSGARLKTYVIAGPRGSGAIGVNGAAVHLIG